MGLVSIFNQYYFIFFIVVDRITRWKYWQWKCAFILSIFSIITSFPDYDAEDSYILKAIQVQFDQPFKPFPEELLGQKEESRAGIISHLDKRWIRIFVPLIGHFTGIKAYQWFIVQFFLGVMFYYFCLKLCSDYFRNNFISLTFTIGMSCLFVGKWIFYDLTIFDGTAYFLMLMALYFKNIFVKSIFVFLSYFVDERAILVSPLLFFWGYVKQHGYDFDFKSSLKFVISLCFLMFLYFLIRWLMIQNFGFKNGFSMVGPKIFFDNYKYLPAGFLLHFEGYWVMIVIVFVILWKTGKTSLALLLGTGLFSVNMMCFIVLDVSRSNGYMFPFLFIFLDLLNKYFSKSDCQKLVLICSTMCFLIPTHIICVDGIYWMSPIFPKILKYLLDF